MQSQNGILSHRRTCEASVGLLFGSNNENESLAMMVTYLGPAPSELLQRNKVHELYFDDHGQWKESNLQPISLEDRLEGGTDYRCFPRFY